MAKVTVGMVRKSIKTGRVAKGKSRAWIKRMAVMWHRAGWRPEWDI